MRRVILSIVLACCVFLSPCWAQKFDFAPINRSELEMKDNPKQPGAHAMILEWRNILNDEEHSSRIYYRIKIFTNEGGKYADVEIPYYENNEDVKDFKARTIHEDGSVITFEGKLMDKLVVKSHYAKFKAKIFTFPNVQPGSVIEYMYRMEGVWTHQSWTIQGDLFAQKVFLQWQPIKNLGSQCISSLTPHGEKIRVEKKSYILEITDLPSFVDESYMPPGSVVKTRMQCWYIGNDPALPTDKFWNVFAKQEFIGFEEFIGHRKSVEQEAISIVDPSDPTELKLHKLYDRVQNLRNRSYDEEKTWQEQQREILKGNYRIDDVLQHGYGTHLQLNLLFAGLVRALGFDANIVEVSRRDEDFFRPDSKNDSLLNYVIIEVNVNGKLKYFDPGTIYCPFGVLRWPFTGVMALRLNKEGGVWITTPNIDSKDALQKRNAILKYEDSRLRGKLTVSYFNQETFKRRMETLREDEIEQKKEYENEVKGWLPQGSIVHIIALRHAIDSTHLIEFTCEIEIPSSESKAESHVLIPIVIFQSSNIASLRHENRKYAVYFDHAFSEIDEVSIELPSGLNVESMPDSKHIKSAVGNYDSQYKLQDNKISMTRKFTVDGFYYPVEQYKALRTYFDQVAVSDQDNLVLKEKQ
jgi:hypothetical protein